MMNIMERNNIESREIPLIQVPDVPQSAYRTDPVYRYNKSLSS